MGATHKWTFHYCEAGKWSILFIQFNSRWKEKPLCCNLLYSNGCKHSVLVVKQTSTLVEVKFKKQLKEDSSAKNITELYNELDHIQVLDSRKKYIDVSRKSGINWFLKHVTAQITMTMTPDVSHVFGQTGVWLCFCNKFCLSSYQCPSLKAAIKFAL